MNALPSTCRLSETYSPSAAIAPQIEHAKCGGLFESKTYRLAPHAAENMVFTPVMNLVLIVSGQVEITNLNQHFQLSSGEIWLAKEEGHCVITNLSSDIEACVITIELHFAMLMRFKDRYEQALTGRIDRRMQIDYFHNQKQGEFIFESCDLTRMALDSFSLFSLQNDHGLFALKLEELLLLKLRGPSGHLLAIHLLNRCDPILERYRRFVENNVLNDWSLSTYAKEAGMSLTSFKVMFSRVFQDASPKAWINERRLRFADTQVRTTRKRLIDIAMESGFSSQSYFTQSYKAHFGESPSEVRQRT
ncbi:MAG: helix-turn-helix transcriptional regulator [Alteromonadaceae bacterium]|nr:helix-turn-helix transcriptional regulator [Alteromonadaceae bacterium]